MRKNSHLFNPPAIIVKDERLQQYRKRLEEARKRQAERDMMAEALIDNAFHGVPYRGIFDEYPWLLEGIGLKQYS